MTDAARLAWLLQAPAFLKKGMPKNFSRLRSSLFEKRLRRKTLVGCAANSGADFRVCTGCPQKAAQPLFIRLNMDRLAGKNGHRF
ncbi:hypothetical protein [Anaerotruncus sp.]|uniref:hypothetical protein n=1 Tax=Anaerotruncus sp. TaxID=1872531 RepID=UPI0025BC2ECC|nr:hypothetical protein [Anaerotruncus sp.]